MELHRNASNNLHREHGPAVVTPQLVKYVVNGQLHRVDGPAVMTSNGTQYYYWKNIFIEPYLWLNKETLPATDILKIPNIEVRRSLMEIIGYEEFLRRAKPKILDEDKKSGAILYKVEMPEDDRAEPLIVIKVIDGTPLKDEKGKEYRREYFIRVPPAMAKCKDAIAWTFEMNPEEYAKLENET